MLFSKSVIIVEKRRVILLATFLTKERGRGSTNDDEEDVIIKLYISTIEKARKVYNEEVTIGTDIEGVGLIFISLFKTILFILLQILITLESKLSINKEHNFSL